MGLEIPFLRRTSPTRSLGQWAKQLFLRIRMHINVQLRCNQSIHIEGPILISQEPGVRAASQISLAPYELPVICGVDTVLHVDIILVKTRILFPLDNGNDCTEGIQVSCLDIALIQVLIGFIEGDIPICSLGIPLSRECGAIPMREVSARIMSIPVSIKLVL